MSVNVYSECLTLALNCHLYNDIGLNYPVPDGFYAYGGYCYTVTGGAGKITTVSSCTPSGNPFTLTSGTTCTAACPAPPPVGDHFLIDDCGGAGLYNCAKGASAFGVGNVISYRPLSNQGSTKARCGVIQSVTFQGVADCTITGSQEGIGRACDDTIHCDFS